LSVTPEFVRWTLAHSCDIRTAFDHWEDPAWAHRQLVPIRAYSEAVREQRIYDGICLAPGVTATTAATEATAFRADEVLEPYGGLQEVTRHCSGCPANVLDDALPAETPENGAESKGAGGNSNTPLAGCFGLINVAQLGDQLHTHIATVLQHAELHQRYANCFPRTAPHWYGFWIRKQLNRPQMKTMLAVFTAVLELAPLYRQQLAPLLGATKVSLAAEEDGLSLPLRVAAYPAGRVEGRKWYVVAHCSRCQAPSNDRTLEQPCQVCGSTGQPNPPRKRCAAGKRPYWPLVDFLGEEQATKWLQQHLAK